jgi:hypothetical protein
VEREGRCAPSSTTPQSAAAVSTADRVALESSIGRIRVQKALASKGWSGNRVHSAKEGIVAVRGESSQLTSLARQTLAFAAKVKRRSAALNPHSLQRACPCVIWTETETLSYRTEPILSIVHCGPSSRLCRDSNPFSCGAGGKHPGDSD